VSCWVGLYWLASCAFVVTWRLFVVTYLLLFRICNKLCGIWVLRSAGGLVNCVVVGFPWLGWLVWLTLWFGLVCG